MSFRRYFLTQQSNRNISDQRKSRIQVYTESEYSFLQYYWNVYAQAKQPENNRKLDRSGIILSRLEHTITGVAMLNVSQYYHHSKDNENQADANE
jgi:hypothetical protein